MYGFTLELPLIAKRSLVIKATKGTRSGVKVTARVRKARRTRKVLRTR